MHDDVPGPASRDLTLSRYVIASPVVTVDGAEQSRLVLSTRSGVQVHLGEVLWQQLQADGPLSLPDNVASCLADAQILVDRSHNELEQVVDENRRLIADNDVLEQVVQPTAACQLGCSYCGQAHQAVQMADEVQDQVVVRIATRLHDARTRGRPYRTLNVGWFGAEPLLGLDAMRRLTPKLRALVSAAGCELTAHIVTNGLRLSHSIAKELQDIHGVTHIEVTLDGPAEWHDKRRHTKSGRPTFHRIFANLLRIAADRALRFELAIRCNVDSANADAIPMLIEQIANTPLRTRCHLYFSPVYAWGNNADEGALSPDDYAAREIEWMAQMLSLGLTIRPVPPRRPIVCIAVQPDARVTDAFGNEFNCTEVSYVPAYGEPNRYSTGNVRVTTKSVLPFSRFNDTVLNGAVPCHDCPLLPVCGGACPKAWEDGKSPCPSHKRNLSHRLLLDLAQRRLQLSAASQAP